MSKPCKTCGGLGAVKETGLPPHTAGIVGCPARDHQIIHGLRSRVFETLGRDNNVIETPDEQCIAAADRMEQLIAVRRAAADLMRYLETSIGVGPLTNNPGKEAAYIRLLREALARATA